MGLFARLLGFVAPYWRRLLAALVCMAVYALLSCASLGMILPFVNVLFERDALLTRDPTLEMSEGADEAHAPPRSATPDPANGSAAVPDGTAEVGVIPDADNGDASRRGGADDPGRLPTSSPAEALESGPAGGRGGDAPDLGGLKDALKRRLLGLFASGRPELALAKICVALLVVFFAKNLFGYLQTFLMINVEQRVIKDLRDQLFTRLSELSLSFFHGKRTGQLISRITNDVTLVRRALVATFASLFREALLTVIYLGVAIWISWRLALVTFVVLPPIMFTIAKVGQRLRRRSARIQEKMADITATLQETITGMRVVKAFAMEEYERRRFYGHTRRYFRSYVRMEALGAVAGPLTEYLGVIGVVAVLWYGGRQVLLAGSVSPDWFLLFLASTLSTMQPLRKLSKANNELQIGLAAARRIFSVLDTAPSVRVRPGAEKIERFERAIAYEGVRFRYESGEDVLKGIDLTVKTGEVAAIVGPSGAGKSTLLDLLPRFYDPIEGRVTIDGRDLRDLDLWSLRRLMGIVTQETILFNDTVRNNIAYGLEGARDEEIVAAARAANADGFIEAMPDGYDTVVGERGVRLSGGERQRIAIARAILKNPPILIFDEATSSLDTESERLVQEAIEHLFRGRTVLLIAHRLSTVSNAERIVVMKDGEIVEMGSHDELLGQDGVYRRLHDMQFRDG